MADWWGGLESGWSPCGGKIKYIVIQNKSWSWLETGPHYKWPNHLYPTREVKTAPKKLCILRHQALVSANCSSCLGVRVNGGPCPISCTAERVVCTYIISLAQFLIFLFRLQTFCLPALRCLHQLLDNSQNPFAQQQGHTEQLWKVVSGTAEKDGLTEAEITHECGNGSIWWRISLRMWCTSSCHCTTKEKIISKSRTVPRLYFTGYGHVMMRV